MSKRAAASAESPVGPEDVLPVKSRVSWGAIAAGAVIALALYFLFTLLAAATGLSVSNQVSTGTLRSGAAVFAVLITVVTLFTGGYVASRLTAGEDKVEGTMYGILVWGATFAVLMLLVAGGVRGGYNALVGLATAGQSVADRTPQDNLEEAARRAGYPQERIDEWKRQAKDAPASVKQAVDKPENQQAATAAATKASWYAFFGAWISMMAAAAGGFLGAGPAFQLFAVRIVRTDRPTP
jgi:hypothetical protein